MCSEFSQIVQKILVVASLVVSVIFLVFAYWNTAAEKSLFLSSTQFIDSKYYQQVSPIGTAFSIIWPIIYLWNFVSALYIFVSMFLTKTKSPVKVEPTLVPIHFLIGYLTAFGSSIAWFFAFDRENLVLSLALLVLATVALYFTIAVSYKRVFDNLIYLENKDTKILLWLVRILIQNGLCIPGTWLTIATLLNLAAVIIYEDSVGITPAILRGNITVENGSTVILSLLLAVITIWFITDNFLLEKYTRHTFTPFLVFIIGCSGIVAKLRFTNDANRNLILALVMLGFSVFALIFRFVFFIHRSKTRFRTIYMKRPNDILI